MMRPEADEVHVSCTFTWDKPTAERLRDAWAQYYPVVRIGGPAFDDPGKEFTPGMYVKMGIVYLSRGCNNQCPWCLAWQREGKIKEGKIVEGNNIQDNNLFQCNDDYIDSALDMLSAQHHVILAGVEAIRIKQRWADRIRGLRLYQIFVAADTPQAIKPVRKALKLMTLPRDKVRCYVLLKYNPDETISDATERLIDVWHAGAIPFAQLYQPPEVKRIEYSKEWRDLARRWSRPAIIKSLMSASLQKDRK